MPSPLPWVHFRGQRKNLIGGTERTARSGDNQRLAGSSRNGAMRTTPAKRRFVGLGLGIGLFLAFAVRPASGSCAGPSVAFEGKAERNVITVHPGDTVSLVGEFWTSDCFDTGPTGACERGPGDERR
jgi:hypothetical protein